MTLGYPTSIMVLGLTAIGRRFELYECLPVEKGDKHTYKHNHHRHQQRRLQRLPKISLNPSRTEQLTYCSLTLHHSACYSSS